MTRLPYDLESERAVIGCVVDHDESYQNARRIVGADDFAFPAHRRLFAACERIVHLREPQERHRVVSDLADVALDDVRRLVDVAPVLIDPSPWARRVFAAAERRRLVLGFDEALRRLEAGDETDSVLNDLWAAL